MRRLNGTVSIQNLAAGAEGGAGGWKKKIHGKGGIDTGRKDLMGSNLELFDIILLAVVFALFLRGKLLTTHGPVQHSKGSCQIDGEEATYRFEWSNEIVELKQRRERERKKWNSFSSDPLGHAHPKDCDSDLLSELLS